MPHTLALGGSFQARVVLAMLCPTNWKGHALSGFFFKSRPVLWKQWCCADSTTAYPGTCPQMMSVEGLPVLIFDIVIVVAGAAGLPLAGFCPCLGLDF